MEKISAKISSGKRIAMFSLNDPLAPLGSQESGGKEVYARYLAEELGKLGWMVDVFTRLDSAHKKQIAKISKNARVIRLKGGPAKYVLKTELFRFLPEIFQEFLNFINHENPYDLFHSHRWDGGGVALMATEKFKKPLIHTFHSLGVKLGETKKKYLKDESEQEYLSSRIDLENRILQKSAKIICLSQSEKEDLEKLYACPSDKISIIPGGVDFKNWPLTEKSKARQYLMIKPEEFVILFIGRLEWRKGLGTLITVGELIKNSIPNLKIIIVGGKVFGRNKNKIDFKEYARLQAMVAERKLDDVVTFTGNIENKALSNFYRSADIFVIPSYYEPFGLVALEGMANQIPVIASDVGGLASIIEHNKTGLLFEPRNAGDLKEKIMALYTSKELAKGLATEAYAEVSTRYSWKDVAKQISDDYSTLLTSAPILKSSVNSVSDSLHEKT